MLYQKINIRTKDMGGRVTQETKTIQTMLELFRLFYIP
jgi:hypothetical protein